ncbi:StsB family radical SAM/SPASM domain sactipeptide maturase [Verrucosispora sp. WMMD1129]|uniref:StsB family radical SAM/SPASM domain sactipeptide maturase n=1 Tax=Verrucosispora sp. WMMD1129 TaxID=3016093 RepID=UPI00249BD846|nr:StsB family radical SAM/SPASM domain sactipeptide maturase [Verrucosispora sp. WMMD1129]WFE45893.1 radical SAM protein [Verrucosispora sp. WMMD1129]
MQLSGMWSELVVPDDLVYFQCRDRYLVENPGIAAWAVVGDGEIDVLRALASGVESPADPATTERALATLVLNWLVYLPGQQPRIRPAEPALRMVYYAITDGCNLRCPYCYASSTRKLPGELEPHESLDLVDQIADMGAELLILTGGEPMLRPDFFTVADHARSRGLRVNCITNGTRIPDEATARRMADTFGKITVSLDGGVAEVHERTRGKGTFARTANALALLNAAGVRPDINHVVSPDNIGALDQLMTFLDGIDFGNVRLMNHTGIGRGAEDGVHFAWEHHRDVQRFTWTNPVAQKILTEGPKAVKPCSIRGNCGLGGTEIYINSLGDVYPCKLVTGPLHKAGNVRAQRLADVFANPALSQLRTNTVFEGENLADCRRCYIRAACGGGCRAYHAAESGSITRNSRHHCRILRHSMIANIWRSNGFTGVDLLENESTMTVPRLIRDGTVHPVYDDWRTDTDPADAVHRRALPVLTNRTGASSCSA